MRGRYFFNVSNIILKNYIFLQYKNSNACARVLYASMMHIPSLMAGANVYSLQLLVAA